MLNYISATNTIYNYTWHHQNSCLACCLFNYPPIVISKHESSLSMSPVSIFAFLILFVVAPSAYYSLSAITRTPLLLIASFQ